jgi:hypothetical protein
MADSILDTMKKTLNIDPSDDAFDTDIMIHINSVFLSLNQLGVGPIDGFAITGSEETWEQYLGTTDKNLSAVKSYMYLRVRLLFDPPATSFAITSYEKQIDMFEFRLNVQAERTTT